MKRITIGILTAAAIASAPLVGCAHSKESSPQHQPSTVQRDPQQDQQLAAQSVLTLKKCGNSVSWYCMENADIAPRSIADIAGSPYGPTPQELHSPFGPAPDARPDYMFRTDMTRYEQGKPESASPLPIAKIDYPSKSLMAIDRSAVLVGSSRIPVLFADGRAVVLARDELTKLFFEHIDQDYNGECDLKDAQYLNMGWLSAPDRIATNHAMISAWGFDGLFTDPHQTK